MAADGFVWKAYQYTPSLVAAIIFLVLFTIVTAFGFYQFVSALCQPHSTRSEKRQICSAIPFLLGGIFELVGYIGRALNHNKPNELGPYIMQSILLLVAPALFAATIYMTLGRVIRNIECEKYSLIPLKWLTKTFVIGDIISFLMQASGGGLMASPTLSGIKTGENVIVGGLFVQIVFFGFFIIVELLFHTRVSKNPSLTALSTKKLPSKFRNWNSILITLLICSVFIFIRSIIRVVEFLQGNDGYIISNEYFLYVFDALLMFLTMVIFLSQDIGSFYVNFKLVKNENLDEKHNLNC